MESTTLESTTSDSKTIKNRRERKRWSDMSNAIGKMKKILIRKGIKIEMELSSQANVLFAVVEWICAEDLHLLFSPLVFNGTETLKEKETRKEQQRKEKHNAAFLKMEKFIVSGENIGKWGKRTIRKIDILEAVLQLIEKKSSNASLPVAPMNTKPLPDVSKSSVASLLKHSVDSMLESPRQMNSKPQPIFYQPMNPYYRQCYYSNITMPNMLVQNQISFPVENSENGTRAGSFFFNS